MKRADRAPGKDSAIPTHPSLASKKAIIKTDPETMLRKNPVKSLKGPSVRYGHQNDVKEQNRLLMGANEDLQKQISELKESVSVLEQRCSDLQENNSGMKKQLRDCHALLIAENLDPVSGEKLGEAAEQMTGQRKELMTVSQKLLMELKQFEDFTKEHRTHLTEVQNTMGSLKEARDKLYLERESFSTYTETMERALEEAERLLID
ncbi:hypothetical protein C0J50_20810 [Silurus asotus]|uniref:Uncharacterized protein n=1 Tax=Silurus asotus TaxID=30991 RepID=A0AAD5FK63_SILAS|nr:hypothetical protein C0J50_20810 [Silurus asotus]